MAQRFVNPYNFIPFSENKAKAYGETDTHTGVITYSVTTKTPLFIPNTGNDNAFCTADEHKSYDFFSYNELESGKNYKNEYFEPVIPGSELRGMIRSIYETLTDSCVSVFNDEMYPERRTGDVFSAGLLYRKEANGKVVYELHKAKSFQWTKAFTNKDLVAQYKEGQKVYFRAGKKESEKNGRKMTTPIAKEVSGTRNEQSSK